MRPTVPSPVVVDRLIVPLAEIVLSLPLPALPALPDLDPNPEPDSDSVVLAEDVHPESLVIPVSNPVSVPVSVPVSTDTAVAIVTECVISCLVLSDRVRPACSDTP
jgi:hypothetical protein